MLRHDASWKWLRFLSIWYWHSLSPKRHTFRHLLKCCYKIYSYKKCTIYACQNVIYNFTPMLTYRRTNCYCSRRYQMNDTAADGCDNEKVEEQVQMDEGGRTHIRNEKYKRKSQDLKRKQERIWGDTIKIYLTQIRCETNWHWTSCEPGHESSGCMKRPMFLTNSLTSVYLQNFFNIVHWWIWKWDIPYKMCFTSGYKVTTLSSWCYLVTSR